jgi:Ca-activated chloride channel homolog
VRRAAIFADNAPSTAGTALPFWTSRRRTQFGVAVAASGLFAALWLPGLESVQKSARVHTVVDRNESRQLHDIAGSAGDGYDEADYQNMSLATSVNPDVLASVAKQKPASGVASDFDTLYRARGSLQVETYDPAASHYYVQDDVRYSPSGDQLKLAKEALAEGEKSDGMTRLSTVTPRVTAASSPVRSPYGPTTTPSAGAGKAEGAVEGKPGSGRYYTATKSLYEQVRGGTRPLSASAPVPNGSALVPNGRTKTHTFTGESTTLEDSLSELSDVQDRESGPLDESQAMGLRGMLQDGVGNTEAYDAIVENPFKDVMQEPLSTFSIDVDTASYANVRRFLTQSTLPPPGAVRLEEMINYFSYDYAQPTGEDPFAVHVEVAQCPWESAHRLVRIGIKGREVAVDKRPATSLVFLIDVSGSMQDANKLELVKTGLRMLTEQLTENDRVAIVVYAGSSGQVLASTPGNQKEAILASLDQLQAGGSTNGAGGIEQAYQVAVESFITGGANRVILCTDGDFNVGVTDESQLVNLIEGKAKSGVFLSVLGFGMGNLKDSTLEKLSDKGNGNYAYIDSEREAKKVLVEQLSGTLLTIAKDVKLQLEFNPAKTAAYRLIGYENRLLAKEDFNDDTKDAGEIGAGHTVTALYEVIPAGTPVNTPPVDPLEYQGMPGPNDAAKQSNDLLMLKLRYKQPDGAESKLINTTVADSDHRIGQATADFQFAASVAAFGMLLRHSPHAEKMNYGAVLELAQPGLARDEQGYRAEFLELVKAAQSLSGGK